MEGDEAADDSTNVANEVAEIEETIEISENSDTRDIDIALFIKYILLGAIAGVFLSAMYIALKYVLSNKLKTTDDIRNAFRLPVIGTVKEKDKSAITLVCSGINACMKNADAQKVYLLGSGHSAACEELKKTVSEKFTDEKYSVMAIDSILSSPESVDRVVDSDGVILFERIGESLYDDIAREIEICSNYGVKILGTVVIGKVQ